MRPRCVAVIVCGCVWLPVGAARAKPPENERLVRDRYGAIIRGDVAAKCLALVFTGDERGESTGPILDTLRQRGLTAGFFVTGNFLRQPKLRTSIERAVSEGHYVGPHSDSHRLYCSWEDRERTLVSDAFFVNELPGCHGHGWERPCCFRMPTQSRGHGTPMHGTPMHGTPMHGRRKGGRAQFAAKTPQIEPVPGQWPW